MRMTDEKENQRTYGHLRLFLEAVQDDRVHQRLPDLSAAPSKSESVLKREKGRVSRAPGNEPGAFHLYG